MHVSSIIRGVPCAWSKTGKGGGEERAREELKGVYLSLNPAELKRSIEAKLDKLFKTYEEKGKAQ